MVVCTEVMGAALAAKPDARAVADRLPDALNKEFFALIVWIAKVDILSTAVAGAVLF